MQPEIALVKQVVYFILQTEVGFGNKVPINNGGSFFCERFRPHRF
jgi:hypothetical protein